MNLNKLNQSVWIAAGIALSACTDQIHNSFRFNQLDESFATTQNINTKIDLLWIVDNSASMDIHQSHLRQAFSAFATKYLKPTWDIQIAVITTDTYLAHTSFDTYMGKKFAPNNWTTTYITNRAGSWVNPSWNNSLLNTGTGQFTNGIKYQEVVPVWRALGFTNGTKYSQLLPGLHDGPIPAICAEGIPTGHYYYGQSSCATRDSGANTGTSHCLNPSGGETAITQCVNTLQNNTVHSGKAIIKTTPPNGTAGDAAWVQQLTNDFMINATTGAAGHGSERGLASMLQLVNDNESTATAFFRPGSIRGIMIVSDEEDQSLEYPALPDANFSPYTYYKCDQASLVALNPGKDITGNGKTCCSNGTCQYGAEGTSCTQKNIDGYTYTPSICAREDKLMTISSIKSQMDTFFANLDGTDTGSNLNYFSAAIVPLTAASIQSLQSQRDTEDAQIPNSIKTTTVDRGDRYLEFGNLVGNGSLQMDIADTDYSPILTTIGNTIIKKSGVFYLSRTPNGTEDMIVNIKHADNSVVVLNTSQYRLEGKVLSITDVDFLLTLTSSDKLFVNYQPRGLN